MSKYKMLSPHSQKGLSLVELMVALVLGLLVVAGVSQAYVAIKRAFTQVDSISERQNKIRFLSDTISLDIRTSSPAVAGPNFVKIDPSGTGTEDCNGNTVTVGGSTVASSAGKTLHIDYSGTRPNDPYCDVAYPDLHQVRYFSVQDSGLYMCYVCVDSSGLEFYSDLYKVDSDVDATFTSLGLNSAKVSLLFSSAEGVDIEGASASSREYFFSSVSRHYVVQRLDEAVE